MNAAATILVATRNRHKVDEIRSILGGGFSVWSIEQVRHPPVLVEDAATFEGNAVAKTMQLARYLGEAPGSFQDGAWLDGLWVLADDSGLEVDELGGAPGVHSARYACVGGLGTGNASDAENNAKLLRLMAGVPEARRGARFRCVLAVLYLGRGTVVGGPGDAVTFEGRCEGRIGFEAKGSGGFGYDPLFRPEGHEATFGELGAETKNGLSHRYRALVRLRQWLGLRLGRGIA